MVKYHYANGICALCAKNILERFIKMQVLEYILLILLLVAAAFIVVAVIFQKSGEDGLSGSIAGGAETFYGKDKSIHGDRKWFKWTLIASVVFCVAVLVVFIMQPDYVEGFDPTEWQNSDYNNFDYIFGE